MAANPNASQVPPRILNYLLRKKIGFQFSHLDQPWREEHHAAFVVAKAMEQGIVDTLRDAVRDAIQQGLPFETFLKRLTSQTTETDPKTGEIRQVQSVLQKLGWWGYEEKRVKDRKTGKLKTVGREVKTTMVDPIDGKEKQVQLGSPRRLKVILNTNTRTAQAVGQWDRIQRTKAALPYLQWHHGHPAHPYQPHLDLNGMVLRADDPFWREGGFPPCHFGCTCYVTQITKSRATAAGGPAEGDVYKGVNFRQKSSFTNPRTGQVVQHLTNVADPRFGFVPQDRLSGLSNAGLL